MRKTCFLITTLLGLGALSPVAHAAAGDHPQINGYYHFWEWDWNLRDYVYRLTVQTVVDGAGSVPVDITFRSYNPGVTPFWTQNVVQGPGTVDQGQIDTFEAYVIALYECNDTSPAANVYNSPSTHNPLGSDSIFDFAQDIGQLRFQSFGCPDFTPPPIGAPPPPPAPCDPDAAPEVLSFDPDSVSFYYTDIELSNGEELTLGFEYDGDQWDFSELYGDPDNCEDQLDTFVQYNLDILTSATCSAPSAYTPAEEGDIAWYVTEVENACQAN